VSTRLPLSTAKVVATLRKGGFNAARFSLANTVIQPGYKASALNAQLVQVSWRGVAGDAPGVQIVRQQAADYLRSEGLQVEDDGLRLVVSLLVHRTACIPEVTL
jgi:hypothetical protein